MSAIMLFGCSEDYKKKLSPKSLEIEKSLTRLSEDMAASTAAGGGVISPELRRKKVNEFLKNHEGPSDKVHLVKNMTVENRTDSHRIPIRLYISDNSHRVVLFAHGGGWVQGSTETHDYLCRKIANKLKAHVVSVDYRLAPEYKYPTQLNDFTSVYKWCISENSAYELGKIKEIILAGDSVGGNLVAAFFLKLKQTGETNLPRAQLLFYPALSDDISSESFKKFGKMIALTTESCKFFMSQYTGVPFSELGGASDKTKHDKFIYPILGDAQEFPHTYVVSAECDVLSDSHRKFVQKLKSNKKISAEHLTLSGTMHGFMNCGKEFDAEISNILEKIAKWVDSLPHN
jgi:acetyl esterase